MVSLYGIFQHFSWSYVPQPPKVNMKSNFQKELLFLIWIDFFKGSLKQSKSQRSHQANSTHQGAVLAMWGLLFLAGIHVAREVTTEEVLSFWYIRKKSPGVRGKWALGNRRGPLSISKMLENDCEIFVRESYISTEAHLLWIRGTAMKWHEAIRGLDKSWKALESDITGVWIIKPKTVSLFTLKQQSQERDLGNLKAYRNFYYEGMYINYFINGER